MSAKGVFLLQSSTDWRIALVGTNDAQFHDLECDREAAPQLLAERVEAFVHQRGLSHKCVVIGVSSLSALAASLSVSPEDQRNRRTMKYEFEHVLPYAAEQIVADFVTADDRVFGVCVETRALLPMVLELEGRGLRVQSISPVALLALQSLLNQAPGTEKEWVLWHDRGSFDLFDCRGKTVGKWCHFAADPCGAVRQLSVESLQQSGPLRCDFVNATKGIAELAADVEFRRVETMSMAEHALRSAASVLEGSASPLIELRREELAAGDPHRAVRGSLRLLYAAAAIFLVVLTSVLWAKGLQYQRRLDQLQQQQVALFRQAYPESRVPAAILSRLRSEHAKLSGARSGEGNVELPVSALHVLLEFLSALPEDQRYRLREFRIEDGKVDVNVELPSHNVANVLVSSFEKRGFSVAPPATVQEGERTVASRIFADYRAADGQQGDGS